MNRSVPPIVKSLILSLIFIFAGGSALATHIFGVDLYYTYVSGNTYTINMSVYGDCGSSTISSLYTATPEVQIYDGSTLVRTVNLNPGSNQGVEVTPVCASQANNTTCTNINSSIPGVRKFTYSLNVTLTGASANWRFHFDGAMGGAPSAGRSSLISNIAAPGTSVIALNAQLNNLTAPNSSSVYTTIPTPFVCINEPENFNPGAIDPNGDSLSFALVPGIVPAGTPVVYNNPFTATNPLAVNAGSFNFTGANGQLAFTPNAVQRSLVVYTVSEYRNGVLVGTSQREMTVVVLLCNNPPPLGSITNVSTTGTGVTDVDSTHLNACGSAGLFSFNVNPTDANTTANITVTYAGLPAGASFTITNNGTPTPHGLFTWNTTGVPIGSYIFYLTFKDDACPLSSTQTVAYTVNVLPFPTNVFSLVSAATCIKKAVFHVTPGGAGSPYSIQVIQASSIIQTISGVTGMVTDSLSPGTYTIRVLNTNGCSADTTVTIAPPIVITPSVTILSPSCPGGNNGSISVSVTGGVSPYTFAIGAGAFSGSSLFSGLTPGTYTIHVRDANLCIKDTSVSIADAPHAYFNAGIVNPWCNFYTNGAIAINASNSAPPYTYAIGSGTYSNTSTFNNLNVGTYTLHIKNANGCISDTTIILADSLIVSASIVLSPISCYGGTNGIISILASGGFGSPYNYAINANPYTGTNSFNNLSQGTYTIHVRDVNQCFHDTVVTLTQPSQIVITPVLTNIACFGAANGSIVVNAAGGTPTYTYSIGNPAQPGNTFSPVGPGNYTITVTDFNNCTQTDPVTITQPARLVISSIVTHNVSCNSGTDGSFTVNPTGGTTPYSYAVNTGTFGSSNVLGGLTVGTYVIHLKDANGCTVDSTMTITQPSVIIPSAAVKNSTCHTLANGSVTISANGGTPGYTYANGAGAYVPSGSFTTLPGGTYTFHIKDANACVKDTTVTIIDSIIIVDNYVVTQPLCYGQSNGSVTVTGSGGAAPYTYAFGSGTYSAGNVLSSIPAGAYVLHAKDANGCIGDEPITVAQPGVIVPAPVITSPSCYGYHNGTVVLNVSGGTPVFQYGINSNGFSSTNTFGNLSAGRDTLHIKDNNGCTHDTIITITQPSQLKITNLAISEVKCFGDASGFVTVTATGAITPYSYAADAGAYGTSNVVSNLNVGSHTINVKDNNGCLSDSVITLTQPAPLVFRLDSLVNPTCQGYTDGIVKLDGVGGTSPYTYAIGTGTYSAQNSYHNLAEGTYTFYVEDKNSCVHDTVITLVGYPHIVIDNVTLKDVTCYNALTGSIQVIATGGAQPLSYKLGEFGTVVRTNTFDSLHADRYTIFISDSMHCMKDTTVSLTQPDSLHVVTTATPNECVGYENMGVVTANVTGGTGPYGYLWNTIPAQTTNTITGMANGPYMVLITDANSCIDSAIALVAYDDCCKPYIPNAFTPNNDGKDDIFRVVYKGDLTLENFSVYNRFGQRVYSSIYLDKGWDGTFNGVPQDMGTYFYFFKGICGNKGDHQIELHGDVTLIR